MKPFLLSALAPLAIASMAMANCPPATVSDPLGVPAGKYPQQYDLSEFQALASCELTFAENPDSAALNSRIGGNPALPPLAERLPEEPLVVAPYDTIGRYGGVLDALSNDTEAGTSDFLSIRHVNLVRFSDDLKTIVPNVARDWQWNEDFTELTIFLRKGHKWSDGHPFTAEDIQFWYENLALDNRIFARTRDYALVGGEKMQIQVVDPQTLIFQLPAPKPGLLAHFATSFAQPFQPKHILGRYHPDINPDADKLARQAGFDSGLDVILAYYGNSDWTDTPSPLLGHPGKVAELPRAVVPTLESHITVEDTEQGRHLVANPYFFMVDTAGNQLPYISELNERYINENEQRLTELMESRVDYKSQSLQLPSAPMLLERQEEGKFSVDLRPAITMQAISFNLTAEDPVKRSVFGDLRFRKAMSLAINRNEINEVSFFGLGRPQQYVGFSPLPDFVDPEWLDYMADYDPEQARTLLDEIGMIDRDEDGFRELPDGAQLVLDMQYSTQGFAGQVAELVSQNWANVGIQANVREIPPGDYRKLQSDNKLDVGLWEKGQPLAIIQGNNELWVPPFENFFGHRTGMLWADWIDSNGETGVEPPEFVKQMIADIHRFQSLEPGSKEADALGERLVKNMTENLLFIGTVTAPFPIYHSTALENFVEFRTASYEFYRTFPYRPQQWWLNE